MKKLKKQLYRIFFPTRTEIIKVINANSFVYDGESYIQFDWCSIMAINCVNILGNIKVTIVTTKPGILIGKGGRNIDTITEILNNQFNDRVKISIKEHFILY